MNPVLRLLREQITGDLTSLNDALTRNAVANIEEYRFVCGQIRGLRTADAYIDDLAKRMESDE